MGGGGRPGGSGLGRDCGDRPATTHPQPAIARLAQADLQPEVPTPQPGSGRSVAAADWLCGARVGRAGPAGNRRVAGARGGAEAASAGATGAAKGGLGCCLLLGVGPGTSRNPGPGGSRTCGAAELGADPEFVPPAESRAQGAPEPEAEELKSGLSGRREPGLR